MGEGEHLFIHLLGYIEASLAALDLAHELASSQNGPDTCENLAEVEGLRDIVVGSELEALYLVLHVVHELGKLQASTGDSAGAKKTLSDLLAKNPNYAKRAEVEKLLSGL